MERQKATNPPAAKQKWQCTSHAVTSARRPITSAARPPLSKPHASHRSTTPAPLTCWPPTPGTSGTSVVPTADRPPRDPFHVQGTVVLRRPRRRAWRTP